MKINDTKFKALLNLLQDDDYKISSLAMEQILGMDTKNLRDILACYQEDKNPQLRKRIHQLGSIIIRRRKKGEFIDAVKKEEVSVWDGLVQLNTLYSPSCDLHYLDTAMQEIVCNISDDIIVSTPYIASLMREGDFSVPEEDNLDVDLYLAEKILTICYGSAICLCALAQHIAKRNGLQLTIVLYDGKFCLIDQNNLLLDPSAGWHMSKIKDEDKFHPCARKDAFLSVLSQLFLIAVLEGRLRELYCFGDLLTALNGGDLDALPFPVGQFASTVNHFPHEGNLT